MTTVGPRTSDHPIDAVFLERWSPRSFTGEPIPHETLMTILEAGRWAMSSYNSQPWHFVYAHRDTPAFATLLDLLIPFNQSWAKTASALVFLVSNSTMTLPGQEAPIPSHSHSADAGAAWAFAAIQATKLGWYTHGMTGFDVDRAFGVLGCKEGHRVELVFAVGRKDDPSKLPEQMAAREVPSDRKPLAEIVSEGKLKG